MSIIERELDPLELIPTLPEEPEANPKREVFLRAIEIIEERGWETGGGGSDRGQPLCLMEAVAVARLGNGDDWDAVQDFVYQVDVGDAYMGNDGSVFYRVSAHRGNCPEDASCWAWNDLVCDGRDRAISALRDLADGKTWAEATA